jgi:hypothetical protein
VIDFNPNYDEIPEKTKITRKDYTNLWMDNFIFWESLKSPMKEQHSGKEEQQYGEITSGTKA